MSILNYANMESDDIVAELLTLQGEHGRLNSQHEILLTDDAIKQKLLNGLLTLLDRIELSEDWTLANLRHQIARDCGLTVKYGEQTSSEIN